MRHASGISNFDRGKRVFKSVLCYQLYFFNADSDFKKKTSVFVIYMHKLFCN